MFSSAEQANSNGYFSVKLKAVKSRLEMLVTKPTSPHTTFLPQICSKLPSNAVETQAQISHSRHTAGPGATHWDLSIYSHGHKVRCRICKVSRTRGCRCGLVRRVLA